MPLKQNLNTYCNNVLFAVTLKHQYLIVISLQS